MLMALPDEDAIPPGRWACTRSEERGAHEGANPVVWGAIQTELITPSLRAARFEDENDDENENEVSAICAR